MRGLASWKTAISLVGPGYAELVVEHVEQLGVGRRLEIVFGGRCRGLVAEPPQQRAQPGGDLGPRRVRRRGAEEDVLELVDLGEYVSGRVRAGRGQCGPEMSRERRCAGVVEDDRGGQAQPGRRRDLVAEPDRRERVEPELLERTARRDGLRRGMAERG